MAGTYLYGRELWLALAAGSVGNFLEWFDFALFGMFANEIADTFFPPSDATTSLLEAFVVFAGAFVMRPVGGVLFGYLGDTYGRVYSMRMAMNLMAVPTTAIALLPGYATLGIYSTMLLVVIRLLQGLSVGGAFGGLMTYAMEVSPPERYGTVSALLKVFSGAGTLAVRPMPPVSPMHPSCSIFSAACTLLPPAPLWVQCSLQLHVLLDVDTSLQVCARRNTD